jgi:hypothetical protein
LGATKEVMKVEKYYRRVKYYKSVVELCCYLKLFRINSSRAETIVAVCSFDMLSSSA